MYQQEPPVVFFSSGPPTQSFRGHGNGPGPHHHFRRCGGGPNFHHPPSPGFSFGFLKPLAMSILSLFALSMLVRLAFFVVAVLFSPPVLLLCLFFLVMNNQGWQQQAHDYWNGREFPQYFRNPRRFRRFFCGNSANSCGGGRSCGPRGPRNCARPTTQAQQSDSTPAAPTPPSPPPPPAQEPPAATPNAPAADDFEMVSSFNMMMAAIAAGDSESNSNTNDSAVSPNNDETPEQAGSDSPARPQYQKVPVHRNETDEALVIAMDISGFDVANIQITAENDALFIRGERTNKIGDNFVVEEMFDLGKDLYDEDSIKANASDGVLEVKIQKKAPPQPRVISIGNGDKNE